MDAKIYNINHAKTDRSFKFYDFLCKAAEFKKNIGIRPLVNWVNAAVLE